MMELFVMLHGVMYFTQHATGHTYYGTIWHGPYLGGSGAQHSAPVSSIRASSASVKRLVIPWDSSTGGMVIKTLYHSYDVNV